MKVAALLRELGQRSALAGGNPFRVLVIGLTIGIILLIAMCGLGVLGIHSLGLELGRLNGDQTLVVLWRERARSTLDSAMRAFKVA